MFVCLKFGNATTTLTALMVLTRRIAQIENVRETNSNVPTADVFLLTGFVTKKLIVLMEATKARKHNAILFHQPLLAIQLTSNATQRGNAFLEGGNVTMSPIVKTFRMKSFVNCEIAQILNSNVRMVNASKNLTCKKTLEK